MYSKTRIIVCVLFCFFVHFWHQQVVGLESSIKSQNPVKVEIVSSSLSIDQQEDSFWLALLFQIDSQWHIYGQNPGGIGFGTLVQWQLPAELEIVETIWPTPNVMPIDNQFSYVYEDQVLILTRIKKVKNFDKAELGCRVSCVACSENECQPFETTLSFEMNSSQEGTVIHSKYFDSFQNALIKAPLPYLHLDFNRIEDELHLEISSKFSSESFKNIDVIPSSSNFKLLSKKESQDGFAFIFLDKQMQKQDFFEGSLVVDWSFFGDSRTFAQQLKLPLSQPSNSSSVVKDVEKEIKKPLDYSRLITTYVGLDTDWEKLSLVTLCLTSLMGGFLLNFLPCVLPVVSLKALNFISSVEGKRKEVSFHSFIFCLGIIICFWILAGAITILRQIGINLGWGFQLQSPYFVLCLMLLMFVMALSLFEVFSFGNSLSKWAPQSKKTSYLSSFFHGIATTMVATPCTGPFLGVAFGAAFLLPPFYALLVLTCIGLGLSLPYLLIGCFPFLISWVPKSGQWMVTFKQIMGFSLLLTVVWLMYVFESLTTSLSGVSLGLGLLFISFSCWCYGKILSFSSGRYIRRFFLFLFGIISLICGCLLFVYQIEQKSVEKILNVVSQNSLFKEEQQRFNYSEDLMSRFEKDKEIVFLEVTADWCLTCQWNHIVLNDRDVVNLMKECNIHYVVADWTHKDDDITKLLQEFKRASIPLYVLIDYSHSTQKILPQILSLEMLKEELKVFCNESD